MYTLFVVALLVSGQELESYQAESRVERQERIERCLAQRNRDWFSVRAQGLHQFAEQTYQAWFQMCHWLGHGGRILIFDGEYSYQGLRNRLPQLEQAVAREADHFRTYHFAPAPEIGSRAQDFLEELIDILRRVDYELDPQKWPRYSEVEPDEFRPPGEEREPGERRVTKAYLDPLNRGFRLLSQLNQLIRDVEAKMPKNTLVQVRPPKAQAQLKTAPWKIESFGLTVFFFLGLVILIAIVQWRMRVV